MTLVDFKSDVTELKQRLHQRHACSEPCLVQTEKRAFHGRTRDISDGGMCFHLRSLGTLKPGDAVSLSIRAHTPVHGIVRWVSERTVGLQFTDGSDNCSVVREIIAQLNAVKDGESNDLQVADETAAIPMKEIIDWVKGLEDT